MDQGEIVLAIVVAVVGGCIVNALSSKEAYERIVPIVIVVVVFGLFVLLMNLLVRLSIEVVSRVFPTNNSIAPALIAILSVVFAYTCYIIIGNFFLNKIDKDK